MNYFIIIFTIFPIIIISSYESNSLGHILSSKTRKIVNRNKKLSNNRLHSNPLLEYNDLNDLIPVNPTPPDYIYVPPEVGVEIYIGSIIAVLPIVWGAIEFYKRIETQRECLLCTGSGLVYVTKSGSKLTRPRKCWSCGGFIPWLGWKMFFFSTFFDIGNGGALQRPAKDYDEINKKIKEELKKGSKELNINFNESESDGSVNNNYQAEKRDYSRWTPHNTLQK